MIKMLDGPEGSNHVAGRGRAGGGGLDDECAVPSMHLKFAITGNVFFDNNGKMSGVYDASFILYKGSHYGTCRICLLHYKTAGFMSGIAAGVQPYLLLFLSTEL